MFLDPVERERILSKPALIFFIDGVRTIIPDAFCVIYVFLLIVCTFLTILVFLFSTMNRVYHRNLKRIYQLGVLVWFVLIVSKILVLVTQRWYFEKDVPTPTGISILTIAAFFRFFYVFFFVSTPLCIIIERTIATFFLIDYERHQRPWIFWSIFLTNFSIATCFSSLIIQELVSIRLFTLSILSTLMLSIILYTSLYWYNSRRFDSLEKQHHRIIIVSSSHTYTLSTKYQLKENLVTLKSMRSLLCVILIAIFTILMANLVPMLLRMEVESTWPIHVFNDIVYHFSPLYTSPACLYFIPQNRELIGGRLGLRKTSSPGHVIAQANEGDVYFNMFQKSLTSKY